MRRPLKRQARLGRITRAFEKNPREAFTAEQLAKRTNLEASQVADDLSFLASKGFPVRERLLAEGVAYVYQPRN